MKVLVCGADGFLGHALCRSLAAAGHRPLRGVRRPVHRGDVAIDYRQRLSADDWRAALQGVDAVINAVGILVERGGACFEEVHARAPAALFEACAGCGVRCVIQISALGAEHGESAYFRSKRAADEALQALPLDWHILRPALVYGEDGRSAAFFRGLASLPLLLLPAGGRQMVQPVHVDDVCAAVLELLAGRRPPRRCWNLVGAAPLTLRALLTGYRRALGLPPAVALALPAPLMALAAQFGRLLPRALLTPDSWRMLQAGNCAPVQQTTELLGRPPQAAGSFIPPARAELLRQRALAGWRGPTLRGVLASIWLVSALVVLWLTPHSHSLELLRATGLSGAAATAALYAAIALDLLLGLATLLTPGRRLWWLQTVVVLAYSAIIALALPDYLRDPFGAVLKNLAVLALLLLLLAEEERP